MGHLSQMKLTPGVLAVALLASCATHTTERAPCGWTLRPGTTLTDAAANEVTFDDVGLGVMADAFNTCNERPKFRVLGAGAAQIRLGGRFRLDSPMMLRRLLEHLPELTVREHGDVIEVQLRRSP